MTTDPLDEQQTQEIEALVAKNLRRVVARPDRPEPQVCATSDKRWPRQMARWIAWRDRETLATKFTAEMTYHALRCYREGKPKLAALCLTFGLEFAGRRNGAPAPRVCQECGAPFAGLRARRCRRCVWRANQRARRAGLAKPRKRRTAAP